MLDHFFIIDRQISARIIGLLIRIIMLVLFIIVFVSRINVGVNVTIKPFFITRAHPVLGRNIFVTKRALGSIVQIIDVDFYVILSFNFVAFGASENIKSEGVGA